MKAFGYEPEKVVVLTDLITKEPKGSAFVKFFSRDDAVGCMNVRLFSLFHFISRDSLYSRNSENRILNGLFNGPGQIRLLGLQLRLILIWVSPCPSTSAIFPPKQLRALYDKNSAYTAKLNPSITSLRVMTVCILRPSF